MTSPVLHIGISTKLYLSYEASLAWLTAVGDIASDHPAVVDGRVALFVAPSTPLLEAAVRILRGSGVSVAAQDVSRWDTGPYTGETGAPLLAQMGVKMAEIGHAERRALLGETDAVVQEKVSAAQNAGLTPLLCVGEATTTTPAAAAASCLTQIEAVQQGPVMIAYEPVWVIGAAEPADPEYIRETVRTIAQGLPAALLQTPVIYGGSAKPGLLQRLRPEVDGLFLGRFAHDPEQVRVVLSEAAAESERCQ